MLSAILNRSAVCIPKRDSGEVLIFLIRLHQRGTCGRICAVELAEGIQLERMISHVRTSLGLTVMARSRIMRSYFIKPC